jgi:hypothetical protein
METKTELDQDIINITNTIQQKLPELYNSLRMVYNFFILIVITLEVTPIGKIATVHIE